MVDVLKKRLGEVAKCEGGINTLLGEACNPTAPTSLSGGVEKSPDQIPV